MVGPTNLNPRAPSSFETLIETGVDAGTLAVVLNWLTFGLPSTKSQRNREKTRAFFHDLQIGLGAVTAPSILARLRTMPASFISAWIFLSL